ncbi:MAG: hypothetical protein U0U67_04190 [Chitinophagales bacterium]
MKTFNNLFLLCVLFSACKKPTAIKPDPLYETIYTFDNTLADKNNYSDTIRNLRYATDYRYVSDGKVNSCMQLYNADINLTDYFNLPVTKTTNPLNYSISCWIKLVDKTNYNYLFGCSFWSATPNFKNVEIGGTISQQRTDDSLYILNGTTITNFGFLCNIHTWNNLTIVLSTANITYYINGIEVFKDFRHQPNSGLFRLLVQSINAITNVDDLHLWNYAITEQQVKDYYNSTK